MIFSCVMTFYFFECDKTSSFLTLSKEDDPDNAEM